MQETVMEPFFRSWSATKYRFANDEARRRFEAATTRNQGDIVLWDLVYALKRRGIDLTDKLEVRSRYNPDMLRKPLERYETGGRRKNFDRGAFDKAYNRVRKMFMTKGSKLKAIPLEDCEFESSSNSGAPYFGSKDDYHDEALKECYAIRNGKTPEPLVIFHRGKNTEVSRPVFGYPFAMTLLETRFFAPYQEALLNTPSRPYAGGMYDVQIAGMINEMRAASDWILELDYRGLDGSATSFIISKAFQMIRERFEMTQQDHDDWVAVVRYHIFAKVLGPDGQIYTGKDHGVSSGSMFTQLVDTIINLLGLFYCKYTDNLNLNFVLALGDDMIGGCLGERPDLEAIANRLADLSLILNTSKSAVKRPKERPHFLGHDWHRMVATRDVEESLIRLCCPEKNRPEYWLKQEDQVTYLSALKERIERYQEDNPDAWAVLQQLLQDILFPGAPEYSYLTNSSQLFFSEVVERVERERYRKIPKSARETVPKKETSPKAPNRVLVSYY